MFNALRADNSPFTELQIDQLQKSLGGLDSSQSVWLSGFIAGRLASPFSASAGVGTELPVHAAAQVSEQERLHVFYASQTGNGEDIARALGLEAEQAGITVEVHSLAAFRPAGLKKLRHAAFVISTHGEGDPPDDAVDLMEYLDGPRAPGLDKLKFRVLALGDASYSQFCESGRRLESLLLARGAKTFAERTECDIDFQASAACWSQEVVSYGQENLQTLDVSQTAGHLSIVPSAEPWTRSKPFPATVEKAQKITALESEKDVYHVELSLEDSGLEYQPGDSLGVWAPNTHEVVSEVLEALGLEAEAEVRLDGHRHTVHEFLIRHRELTRLSADTIQSYAELSNSESLSTHFVQLDDIQKREFIEQRQFIDLVQEYPPAANNTMSAQGLAGLLRPLTPRSYSIASSQASVDEEVHLTVATVFSQSRGEQRRGVASDFLNHHLEPGDQVNVFLEPNRRFRLPENRDTPLILISAGTGVAPYRGFLQQLEAQGHSPNTWLIFGNPHMRTDFLYQKEWLDWRDQGLLTRIDGAFSRDQAEKVYVQHIVRNQAVSIQQWLDDGASLYICGGLSMGHEVEDALRDVIAGQQGISTELANEKLADLRRQGRLLKDLY
jgi:sulfite reductase (NADPH) flavoprotein alpha-component